MKKVIFSLLLALGASVTYAQENDSTFKTYHKKNFSLSYPSSWKLDSVMGAGIGAELFLIAPLRDENPAFNENINVMLQDLALYQLNLEQYKTLTEKQISEVPGAVLLESVIAGTQGKNAGMYQFLITFKMGERQLKARSYCYIKNGTAYLVTFTAEEMHYDKYWKEASKILDSFVVN